MLIVCCLRFLNLGKVFFITSIPSTCLFISRYYFYVYILKLFSGAMGDVNTHFAVAIDSACTFFLFNICFFCNKLCEILGEVGRMVGL